MTLNEKEFITLSKKHNVDIKAFTEVCANKVIEFNEAYNTHILEGKCCYIVAKPPMFMMEFLYPGSLDNADKIELFKLVKYFAN